MRRVLLSAALLAVLFVPALHADTVTLTASRDNTLYESSDGTLSSGAGRDFFVGFTNDGAERRGLVAFDLSSIPAGSRIDNVVLRLQMNRTRAGVADVGAHRVAADWGEGASSANGGGAPATDGDATWIHTFFPDQRWQSPGGDFEATASATTAVGGDDVYEWSSALLSADVQAWLDEPSSNFGWLLLTSGGAKRFTSREGAEAQRPQLIVDFTPTGPPIGEATLLPGAEPLTDEQREFLADCELDAGPPIEIDGERTTRFILRAAWQRPLTMDCLNSIRPEQLSPKQEGEVRLYVPNPSRFGPPVSTMLGSVVVAFPAGTDFLSLSVLFSELVPRGLVVQIASRDGNEEIYEGHFPLTGESLPRALDEAFQIDNHTPRIDCPVAGATVVVPASAAGPGGLVEGSFTTGVADRDDSRLTVSFDVTSGAATLSVRGGNPVQVTRDVVVNYAFDLDDGLPEVTLLASDGKSTLSSGTGWCPLRFVLEE